MAKVGSLIATLGLDQAKWEAGLKRAGKRLTVFRRQLERNFKRLRRSVNQFGTRMVKLAAQIALVAGPIALIALTKSTRTTIDEMAKFARVVGTTQTKLAGLQLAAATFSGLADNTVNMALQRMTRRMAEAAKGTGEAKDAIKQLGLDAVKLAKGDSIDAIHAVADALMQIEDPAERLRLSFKLLDSEGARLVTTLIQGSKKLKEFEQRAIELGIAISEKEVKAIEDSNDAMLIARKAASALGITINKELSPFITDLANQYTDATLAHQGYVDEVRNSVNAVVDAIGFILDAWDGVKRTVEIIGRGLAAQMAALVSIAKGDFLGAVSIINKLVKDTQEILLRPLPSKELETYVKNIRKAAEGMVIAVTPPVNISKWTEFWDAMLDKVTALETSFESVFDKWDKGIKGMRDTFKDNIRKMIKDLISSGISELIKRLFNLKPGGGAGGFFGKLLGLQGFASGGSFEVGGRGGTDANIVAFKATKGETVTVSRSGVSPDGGASVVFNNTYDFRGSSLNETEVRQMISLSNQKLEADIKTKIRKRRF